MGEEHKIAKRVVELSMQLANSRADVENLRMRIKAVDKEHEQLKKDRADMVDRFDAALRRAKAEGMREAAIRAREFSRPYSMEWWMTLSKREISAVMCRDVADALDARAAQIEEGSDGKSNTVTLSV